MNVGRPEVMDSVFILRHVHEVSDESDEKLIGSIELARTAEAAIHRVQDKQGFRDARDGFQIAEYVLGKDEWTEGYVSWADAIDERTD
jgi:hypothetical protein